ncbi:ketoacyl-ACP synthase III [Saprospiraceae bacterium]|nr:ketoacyl-ACP synthase III [Saprospiraceae bacterium]
MAKTYAVIKGVQGSLPDYILTNKELETMVDTNDEWITSRTGIKERRILKDKDKAASDLAADAIEKLLAKTGTAKEEIELVIVGTVTGDMVFPDTANIACDKAGLPNAFGFDINAACSGFLFSLTTGAQYIESGRLKKVIVVGVDIMSSIIDYSDRTTCVIFGDGCGAVLLEASEEYGVIDSVLKGDGAGRHYLHMKAGGSLKPTSEETIANREHYVYQEGRTVFKHAVKGMSSTVTQVMERNNLTVDDIDWVVPHQANMRIISSVADMLDFPMEKVMQNISHYGNTTAGTLPLCLWDYESKLKKGDKLILTAFGGGFTWGATYLIWGYDS